MVFGGLSCYRFGRFYHRVVDMQHLKHKGFPAIVNLDGKPFPDYQSADFLRDQLTEIAPEYGFTVQDLPTGGFIVVQSVAVVPEKVAEAKISGGKEQRKPEKDAFINVSPKLQRFVGSLPLVLHPAWRNYLLRWLFVLFLVGLANSVDFLIANFISQDWLAIAYAKVPRLNRFVEGSVWLFVIYHTLYIFKEIYTNTYTIAKEGLKSKKGIISRDAHSIKYRDIRGINLRQDVLDRLFGVGTIEFYTAGTDAAEVVFFRIARPAYLRDMIDSYAVLFKQHHD